jgi:hypothetical protein
MPANTVQVVRQVRTTIQQRQTGNANNMDLPNTKDEYIPTLKLKMTGYRFNHPIFPICANLGKKNT